MNPTLIRAIFCLLLLGVTGRVIGQSHQTGALMSQQAFMQRIETQQDMLLLDVRTAREFGTGHVPGAINIPHNELARRLDEVRAHQDKDVIVYCEVGGRAGIAERFLRQAGFRHIWHLEGDMAAWRQSELPMEKATP